MTNGERFAMVAFLDLVTCGLAAGLLLMLIAATRTPSPSRLHSEVVWMTVAIANDSPIGDEIGIRYRLKGEFEWMDGLSPSAPATLARKHLPASMQAANDLQHGALMERAGGVLLAWATLEPENSSRLEVQAFIRSVTRDTQKLNTDNKQPNVVIRLLSSSGDNYLAGEWRLASSRSAGDASPVYEIELNRAIQTKLRKTAN